MSIINIIEPIKLLLGHHDDTGSTGKGCFMDVISYLNGDDQITDQSTCVCFVVRPIVIWLNDYLYNAERSRMLPYIERAKGSASDNPAVFVPRAKAAARFAMRCNESAQASAASAASAAEIAAEIAAVRAERAAASAASAVKWADSAASAARAAAGAVSAAESAERAVTWLESAAKNRQELITAAFTFLDEALPFAVEHPPVVAERARKLIELTT